MRKLKGALVGYGFIAEHGHLPAYAASPDLEITAIADICPGRRELAARAHPNARIFDDHHALLAAVGREIDFLDVCTPPNVHAAIAQAGLSAGLHVLCEKPLTTRVEDARALLSEAANRRLVLFPSCNYKHAPVIKAVRTALAEDLIGKVHLVTLETFRNTHARGVSEWNEHWRRQKQYSGGGIAMDHGSHTFYLAFEWLRSYPVCVNASMSSMRGDTEDLFTATITFPTGIAVATLTWNAGFRKVIYTLHGERGAIRVEGDDVEMSVAMPPPSGPAMLANKVWDVRRQKISSSWMDASHATWFGSMLARFRDAVETHDIANQEAEDALRCVELISSAYASAADGSETRRLSPAPVRTLAAAVPE